MVEFTLREPPGLEEIEGMSKRYPDIDPTAVNAYLTLLRVSADVFNAAGGRLSGFGVTPGRMMVLMLLNLDRERGLHPSRLAERAGVTRATMSGLISGLEDDGLVERRPHPESRREIEVFLTRKGMAFVDSVAPGHFRAIAELMGGLGGGERETLLELLGKIRERIDAFAEEPYAEYEEYAKAVAEGK